VVDVSLGVPWQIYLPSKREFIIRRKQIEADELRAIGILHDFTKLDSVDNRFDPQNQLPSSFVSLEVRKYAEPVSAEG
jgi:hypothetical protein